MVSEQNSFTTCQSLGRSLHWGKHRFGNSPHNGLPKRRQHKETPKSGSNALQACVIFLRVLTFQTRSSFPDWYLLCRITPWNTRFQLIIIQARSKLTTQNPPIRKQPETLPQWCENAFSENFVPGHFRWVLFCRIGPCNGSSKIFQLRRV